MAETCYKPKYLPGSFKLIPFVAIEAESQHGRRGAQGEFPFAEQTAYADMGRKIRTYTIRARLQGNNHILEAAALIAACESPNPGVLVHPTRGVIASAACTSIRVSDKVEEEQGVTYVDLEFVEANNWPNGLSLVGQLLGLALGVILGSSRDSFRTRYRPDDVQVFRREAVIGAAQQQITNLREEFDQITATTRDDEVKRARISYNLRSLASNDSLAADTATMDRGLADSMSAIASRVEGNEQFDVFRRIANRAAIGSSFNSPAKEAQESTFSNVRVQAAAYMAEGAVEAENNRRAQVYTQLDIVDAILTQEMDYARQTCDNALFIAISKFRTEVATQLYQKAYTSPGLVEYDFPSNVHPLAAAYSIYGDAKRHRELEGLNVLGTQGRFGATVTANIPQGGAT